VRAVAGSSTLNDGIDPFLAAALAKNAPVSLIKYSAGDHGFEILNDTGETRRVTAQSLAWVEARLRPSYRLRPSASRGVACPCTIRAEPSPVFGRCLRVTRVL
jgi:hypothetical protein